jgi:hypothetical protein
MTQGIQVLTAETDQGRRALADVMARSYTAEMSSVSPPWALVRVVEDVPVSFILIDPERRLHLPHGDLRYAFIGDVATAEDRRGEGHFRAIMQEAFRRLRQEGIALVLTHGRCDLYRRFGFAVFTHHAGIFVTPALIERALGVHSAGAPAAAHLVVLDAGRYVRDDLLLVADAQAPTLGAARTVLQTAAALARQRGKARILIEHPAAPSYGSRYPLAPAPAATPLALLAPACGGCVCVQGADPEGRAIPDADWIKILDPAAVLRQALPLLVTGQALPTAAVCLDTAAGPITIASSGALPVVAEGALPGVTRVRWPLAALAHLLTGYRSVEVLSVLHDTPLSTDAKALLEALCPPRWRFSRNETWTYQA